MPVVEVEVQIHGVTPDPTSTTNFNWDVAVSFNASGCPHGPNRTINHPAINSTTAGGNFTVPFSRVRGGNLTIAVSARVGRAVLVARSRGLTIHGTNPPIASIDARLPHKTLRQIARQESIGGKPRQFQGAVGATGRCPQFNTGGDGGTGAMQITKPRPTDNDFWSWKSNVDHGIEIFEEEKMKKDVEAYPARVAGSQPFKKLVEDWNRRQGRSNRRGSRLPELKIKVPEFTKGDFDDNLQQRELATIRAFNGNNGRDGFTIFGLHEFRIARERDGSLRVVDIDPVANTGSAVWEQVPWKDRPKGGDPNYVNHVRDQHL